MKILIVDDSSFICKTVARIVAKEHPDWEYKMAHCADDAIALLEAEPFDYFTVDFNMPEKDGTHVIKAAKLKYPDAKIALLTANKQQAIVEKAAALGITFIPKPDFTAELTAFLGE